jgi:NADH-quinone oxidoreductase subunit E
MSEVLIQALSDEEVTAIEAEIAHLPDRQSAAIEALQIVQKARGWISDESLQAIATLLEMSHAELDSIATFYNLIFREPVGRHVVMVCDSVSCYVMGCNAVNAAMQDHLQIAPGHTTQDGRFTLLPIVCLGACDRAPVVLIDEDLHGNVKPAEIGSILESYK